MHFLVTTVAGVVGREEFRRASPVRRVLAPLFPEAFTLWSETEWHDLFGAEVSLRRPVSSLIRAWGTIFAMARPYYRRQ